ncbi:Protein NRT1/ PTR FAMILY 2.13 [Glycine soja]|uniref:Protein NRT1/ PTR FAMILY 2.13 n=1 Tax=Glycine soja TaxID=3848 RepID=A0A445L816_GLYSO|nr:Protein NRT1/ PTR FAMILY 2.13 [Glycine soja]
MFTLVGHIQFYSTESLDKMKSIGNSLQYLVVAFSIYVGTLLVNVVHQLTRKHGGIDWLNDDINAGRLDYYYFLMAGLALINLVYILFCVKHYRYKVDLETVEPQAQQWFMQDYLKERLLHTNGLEFIQFEDQDMSQVGKEDEDVEMEKAQATSNIESFVVGDVSYSKASTKEPSAKISKTKYKAEIVNCPEN